MDNPCSNWLLDSNWDNISELDKLTNFHGLMASFEQYPRDWHLWYTNPEPEKAPLPGIVCQVLCTLWEQDEVRYKGRDRDCKEFNNSDCDSS